MSKRKSKYLDYIDSSHWKQLRKSAFVKHGKFCVCCYTNQNLQMHHLIYRDFYSVTVDEVRPLCKKCHKLAHGFLKEIAKQKLPFSEKWEICQSKIIEYLKTKPHKINKPKFKYKIDEILHYPELMKQEFDILCKKYGWIIVVKVEDIKYFIRTFYNHNRSSKRFARWVEKYALSVEKSPLFYEWEK
jgi:hypothetical protein